MNFDWFQEKEGAREEEKSKRENFWSVYQFNFSCKGKKNACNYSVEEKKKKKDSSGTPVSAINQINKKLLN